ncbi:MAG: hypothetical protein QXF12_05925 [Candidatus Aenigmatarchaeota archaeon]
MNAFLVKNNFFYKFKVAKIITYYMYDENDESIVNVFANPNTLKSLYYEGHNVKYRKENLKYENIRRLYALTNMYLFHSELCNYLLQTIRTKRMSRKLSEIIFQSSGTSMIETSRRILRDIEDYERILLAEVISPKDGNRIHMTPFGSFHFVGNGYAERITSSRYKGFEVNAYRKDQVLGLKLEIDLFKSMKYMYEVEHNNIMKLMLSSLRELFKIKDMQEIGKVKTQSELKLNKTKGDDTFVERMDMYMYININLNNNYPDEVVISLKILHEAKNVYKDNYIIIQNTNYLLYLINGKNVDVIYMNHMGYNVKRGNRTILASTPSKDTEELGLYITEQENANVKKEMRFELPSHIRDIVDFKKLFRYYYINYNEDEKFSFM